MSTLTEIEAAAESLPQPDKEALFAFLAIRLGRTAVPAGETPSAVPGPRIAGLHAGTWEVEPDFDAPLPDEFWLGKEA